MIIILLNTFNFYFFTYRNDKITLDSVANRNSPINRHLRSISFKQAIEDEKDWSKSSNIIDYYSPVFDKLETLKEEDLLHLMSLNEIPI